MSDNKRLSSGLKNLLWVSYFWTHEDDQVVVLLPVLGLTTGVLLDLNWLAGLDLRHEGCILAQKMMIRHVCASLVWLGSWGSWVAVGVSFITV